MGANLPKQVKKQLEEAERIQRDLDAAARGESPPPGPTPEPAIQPAPQPVPQPENIEDPKWEQRYATLQAKYDAEVPRLNQTVRAQSDQITALFQQVHEMQDALIARPAPTQPEAPAVTGDSPEEIEVFGADLLALINRKATAIAKQMVGNGQGASHELVQRVEQVEQRQVVSDKDRFLIAMDTMVPGWRQTNMNKAFLDWCAGQDPLTGQIRQDLLSAVVNQHDAVKTSKFFTVFWETNPQQRPGPAAPAAPAQQVPAGSSLEEEVVPNRRVAPPTSAPISGRLIPRSEISQFYKEVSLGKWVSRVAEKTAREQEFYKARQEGRITEG